MKTASQSYWDKIEPIIITGNRGHYNEAKK